MIIDVQKLNPDGEWFEGEESASILDLESDRFFKVSEPIHYQLFAQPLSDRLVVKGSLRLPLQAQCGRCAEFFSTSVEENSFLRAYEISEATETVDVTPDIREDVLVQVPHYPVCSPECRGLCPQCGTNLNLASCACRPSSDLRWSALDNAGLG